MEETPLFDSLVAAGKVVGAEFADSLEKRRSVEHLAKHAGDGHLVRVVLMPNFRPGMPFVPPAGYVLVFGDGMPASPAIFDVATLFKGRTLLKLVDVDNSNLISLLSEVPLMQLADRLFQPAKASKTGIKIEPAFTAERFLNLTHESIRRAFELVNKAADRGELFADGRSEVMRLQLSTTSQSSVSLMETTTTGNDVYVLCDLHAYPAEVGLLEQELEASGTFVTFMKSRKVKAYYLTLKLLRSVVCHLVMRELLSALSPSISIELDRLPGFGPLNEDTNLPIALPHMDGRFKHFITNDHSSDESNHYFYSNALDASGGALITNGPFCEAVWVNNTYKATAAIHAANRADGVPYDLPPAARMIKTIEEIIMERLRPGAADSKEVRHTEDGTVILPLHSHKGWIRSVCGPFNAGPSAMQRLVTGVYAVRAKDAVNCLVWGDSKHFGDLFCGLPTAVADESPSFRSPLGTGLVKVFEDHGVDIMNHLDMHALMRVVVRALGPVSVMDQLILWRAAEQALKVISS